VLVVEGDHIHALGESQHGIAVGVPSELGDRKVGRLAAGGGKHTQLDAEVDGRGDHHAGELAAADHSDDGGHLSSCLTTRG